MANLSNSSNLINKVNSKQDLLVSGTNIKTVNNASLLGSGNISIESGHDYSWETKTISSGAVTLGLRTIVEPNSNFTVNKPATLEDGMEYVLRCVNGGTAYTLTLGTGIINDFGTDLTLHANHSDQFTFVAVDGTLELQPEYKLASDVEVDDTAYASSWNGVTGIAPSKNAVYDKISAMDTTISGKADSSSLGTAATKNTGTSSGNVPVLDSNGKLNTSVLPAIAITDTFTVTNKSDLTGLSSAQKGDIAIVTSESKTYILSADGYSTASNWKELATPTDAVSSVNSKTGAVTLTTDDISVANDKNYVSTTEKSTWSGKQDALSSQTAYTSKGTSSKVPQITTNSLGQVTGITEVDITHPSQIDNTAYGTSWNGVTDKAPTKDAVYDKINTMDTTIGGKADDSGVVHIAGSETITGQKTFDNSRLYVHAEAHFNYSGEPIDYAYGHGVDLFSKTSMIEELYTKGVFKRAGSGETERTWTLPSDKSGTIALTSDVLTKTNTTAFTPTGDYNPSTKKYVDDKSATVMTAAQYGQVSDPIAGKIYFIKQS